MIFKDFTVKNFRGIKELYIPEFGDINIIVGDNNCGKTSILEAIWMIINPTDPTNLMKLDNIRGIHYTHLKDYTIPFYQRISMNSPYFSATIEGEKRQLEIKLKNSKTVELTPNQRVEVIPDQRIKNNIDIKNELESNCIINGVPYVSKIIRNQVIPVATGYTEKYCVGLCSANNPSSDSGSLRAVIENNQEDQLLNVCKNY